MVICHEKRCIYIHIPKTAGTSVEHFLRDGGLNSIELLGVRGGRSTHHYTTMEIKNMFPESFLSYYKFSIIRNPYDRLLSEYYWKYSNNKTKDEFLDFVADIMIKNKYFSNIYYDHFIPQYVFLYNKSVKKLLVNQLFKYEDLEWVAGYLKRKLKISVDFPNLNKSKNEIKEDWSCIQREKIYNLYKKDFELFSYIK